MLNVNRATAETINKNIDQLRIIKEPVMIDVYNRIIVKNNLSATITTRVSASNNIYSGD